MPKSRQTFTTSGKGLANNTVRVASPAESSCTLCIDD